MSRPRRSLKPNASYVMLPLPSGSDAGSDSDASSSDDNNGMNDQNQNNGSTSKSQGKRNSPSPREDEPDTDMSEYEPESSKEKGAKGKGKATAKGKAVDSQEESSDTQSEGSVTDDSGSDKDEELSGSIVGWHTGSESGSGGERGGKHKALRTPKKNRKSSGSTAPATAREKRTPIIISGAVGSVARPPKTISARAKCAFPNNDSHLGHPPAFEPPSRWLADSTDTSLGTSRGPALSAAARYRFALAWMKCVFKPNRAMSQDTGWWKGKWNAKGMNTRWGGWYDEVRLGRLDAVPSSSLDQYLPKLVYPSQEIQTHLLPKGAVEMEADANEVAQVKLRIGSLSPGSKDQELISLERFSSRRLDEFFSSKPGHLFNAGGPISGIAWCPREDSISHTTEYLALSTLSSPVPLRHSPSPSPAMIQVWSLDTSLASDLARETTEERGEGLKFVMGICVEVGEALDLQWCPKGGEVDPQAMQSDVIDFRLGLLAGIFTDGSISIFLVPNPDSLQRDGPQFIKARPILRLALEVTSCLSFAWMSHETIAAGCMNGSIAVWNIGEALRKGSKDARPTHYVQVAQAAIRSVAAVRAPPFAANLDASVDIDAEPTSIVVTSYDGATYLVDLRDVSSPALLSLDRADGTAVTYDSFNGAILGNDSENRVRSINLQNVDFAGSRKVMVQRGMIWSISVSDHHPFVASSSADGSCTVTNVARAIRKRSHVSYYSTKVYRIDFNRRTGEYRMIDNVKPELRNVVDVSKKGAQRSDAFEEGVSDAAWAPEIGVLRSAWHPSLLHSCLLASGMACGFGRIDLVEASCDFSPDQCRFFRSETVA